MLEEQRRSGLTVEGFARKHGCHGSRLRWWKKRLDAGESSGRMQLLPVRVVPTAAVAVEETFSGLEVALRNGMVLRVSGRWDAATVRAVVTGVEGC